MIPDPDHNRWTLFPWNTNNVKYAARSTSTITDITTSIIVTSTIKPVEQLMTLAGTNSENCKPASNYFYYKYASKEWFGITTANARL